MWAFEYTGSCSAIKENQRVGLSVEQFAEGSVAPPSNATQHELSVLETIVGNLEDGCRHVLCDSVDPEVVKQVGLGVSRWLREEAHRVMKTNEVSGQIFQEFESIQTHLRGLLFVAAVCERGSHESVQQDVGAIEALLSMDEDDTNIPLSLDMVFLDATSYFSISECLHPGQQGGNRDNGDLMESSGFLDDWLTLQNMKLEKRIKSIGLVNISIPRLEAIACHTGKILDRDQTLQAPNNRNYLPSTILLEASPYAIAWPLIQFARSRQIEVAIKLPLKHAVDKQPIAIEHSVVKGIAAKHQKSPIQILSRWCYQHGFWSFPTICSSGLDMSPEEMGEFRDIYRGIMNPLANRPKHCSSTKVYMFHLSADDMACIDGLVKKQVVISSSK